MTFNLTQSDLTLTTNHNITIQNVQDVGGLNEDTIRFQFPPIIKGDKKDGKWEYLYNVPGYEPKYQYQGANPRTITLEATYVIGGPPIQGVGQGSSISGIQTVLRTWKKYLYTTGISFGKKLPIWRITYLGGERGFISRAGIGSAWRLVNYNVSYSDEWIREGDNSHPIISTITVELALSTQVAINKDDPKQDHDNVPQVAKFEWY